MWRGRMPWLTPLLGVLIGCSGAGKPPGPVDLDGDPVRPLAAGTDGRWATVLIFVKTDCPISNRYAPRIQEIVDAYSPRGVRFHLVYPDRKETPGEIRRHLEAYTLSATVVRDLDHSLVRETGVVTTPEVAVLVPGGGLVYRGRIDDRYVDFGKARRVARRRDLEEVLEGILAGRTPPQRRTRAVGCPIPGLEGAPVEATGRTGGP